MNMIITQYVIFYSIEYVVTLPVAQLLLRQKLYSIKNNHCSSLELATINQDNYQFF